MFTRRVAAIVFIFICASIAWGVLGSVTSYRTYQQDNKLKQAVGELWGTAQKQEAARVDYYEATPITYIVEAAKGNQAPQVREDVEERPYTLDASDINVGLSLEHRKKGLLWYATYRVNFKGSYQIKNDFNDEKDFLFTYAFPSKEGIYDNFAFAIDGQPVKDPQLADGAVTHKIHLRPQQTSTIDLSYGSRGMDEWWYASAKMWRKSAISSSSPPPTLKISISPKTASPQPTRSAPATAGNCNGIMPA